MKKVKILILATDPSHERTGDEEENLLIDIDLSILGASPEEYEKYAQSIRKEYAWVEEQAYRKGRIAVLEKISTGRIFHTPHFQRLEEQAQENIREEINNLDNEGK